MVYLGRKNYKYIKVHTTNDTNSPNFTISRQELKWFLGNFLKANCKSNNRKLLFVIKEDGNSYWEINSARSKTS